MKHLGIMLIEAGAILCPQPLVAALGLYASLKN